VINGSALAYSKTEWPIHPTQANMTACEKLLASNQEVRRRLTIVGSMLRFETEVSSNLNGFRYWTEGILSFVVEFRIRPPTIPKNRVSFPNIQSTQNLEGNGMVPPFEHQSTSLSKRFAQCFSVDLALTFERPPKTLRKLGSSIHRIIDGPIWNVVGIIDNILQTFTQWLSDKW